MMSKIVALVLVAAATTTQGEVEVNARDNSIVMTRRETGDFFALSSMVEQLSTAMASADGPAAAVARDMADRTMGLMSTATANTVAIQMMQSSMTQLQTTVTNQLNDAAAAAITQAAADRANVAQALQDGADETQLMLSTMRAEFDELAENITISQLAAQNATQQAISAMNRSVISQVGTVTTALNSKASVLKHIWIGGCSQHQNGGWNDACLDRNEVNTAAPKFRKASNTRMAAIVAGYFRMNWYAMNNSCSWARFRAICNNQEKIYSYFHTSSSWWKSGYTDTICHLTAGQQFYFSSYASCHTSKHHTSGSGRYHERQDYMFLGHRTASEIPN